MVNDISKLSKNFSHLRIADDRKTQSTGLESKTSTAARSVIDESIIPRPGAPVTGLFLRKYTSLFSQIARFLDPTPNDFLGCFHLLPQMNNATYPPENQREAIEEVRFQNRLLAGAFVQATPEVLIQQWLRDTFKS